MKADMEENPKRLLCMELSERLIPPSQAGTLPGLFAERVRRTPEAAAYRFFDVLNGVWTDISWRHAARQVARWRAALLQEKLKPGDRVAIMARNSHLWVYFDQAALSLGLVVVPLFANDRADNIRYILDHAGVSLLIIGGEPQWHPLRGKLRGLRALRRIVSIAELESPPDSLRHLGSWLPEPAAAAEPLAGLDPDALATIVYTSGTTGPPKGVMLSHRNILTNAWAGLQAVPARPGDVFLSFLPLSHTLERTTGYYLPMMAGATVAHARSVQELAKDLVEVRPTCLISVPRIYERVYARVMEGLKQKSALAETLFDLAVDVGWQRFERAQGRARWAPRLLLWPLLRRMVADRITRRLGGRLRVAITGGAGLSPEIARAFLGLGVPLLQGYGLTEASPVVSVNRLDCNVPGSIGPPLPDVEVEIGEGGELLVRGENVMQGYWRDKMATAQTIDGEGWLHTGDKARLEQGILYITGRLKEIIVLSTGEKVAPADMERAIVLDPLFEQAMVIGEGMPYLCALVVIDGEVLAKEELAGVEENELEELLLERIARSLHDFPAYADVRHVSWTQEPWTIDNGLLTPILKLKRGEVCEAHAGDIARMYAGHDQRMATG